MGIFSGILCLICFCLLSAKAATAKLHFQRMDKILMKIHKPVSAFLIIMCPVHIYYVVPILENRSLLVPISGIVITTFMIFLICLCHVIKGRKKILWHRILAALMAIGIMGHLSAYLIDFSNYQKNIANIEINSINLENVENGFYIGEYDVGYIYAKVEVEIKDSAIVSINLLEHRNERGKHAEDIIDDIISEQKLDVDTISGATNSSNVIKKAIEKAIIEGTQDLSKSKIGCHI